MASSCDGVDVVVISSGFKGPDRRMKDAINKLDSKGVIVVCAAGNDGANNRRNIKYPACYPQTICVGAHDRNGHPCSFSSVGGERAIDFFALGENIVGPIPGYINSNVDQKYVRVDEGTSFVALAVGALICLILQAVKDTCKKQHYELLKETEQMKTFLRKLSTDERVISYEKLKVFFDKDGPIGPKPALH